MKPLVGLILVNYNGYEDTEECIKSLKKLYYDNCFIVTVDNGSSESVSKERVTLLE